MAKYSFHERIRDGLKSIISLNEAEFAKLSSIVNNAEIGHDIKQIVESSKSEIDFIPHETFINVIGTLFSLTGIFKDRNDDSNDVIKDIINSFKDEEKDISESDLQILEKYLNILISSHSNIKVTIKAGEINNANPLNFRSVKIISDIRMVFDDDQGLSESKQYAVIVHHLRILNFDSTDRESYAFTSLNSSDLIKLKSAIDRAIEKDKLMRDKIYDLEFIKLD
jgi:hypothetical protein